MERQEFYWGYVEWLHQLEGSVNIGVSHIKGYGKQLLHSHYGNEQYIYVLDGKGEYEVHVKKHNALLRCCDIILPGGAYEDYKNKIRKDLGSPSCAF